MALLTKKALALLIAIVAVSAGLVGYVAATQGPSIAHAFADSTTTSSITPSSSSGSSSASSSTTPCGPGQWMMTNNGGGMPGFQPRGQFGGGFGQFGNNQQVTTIATGTTITITSTQGEFRVVGNSAENGTASATLTFTVNSELSRGYVLTLSSGTITINGTAYTVSSGSAQMNLAATGIQGQGTASSNSSFIIMASAHGNFTGTTSATATLDFKSGSTEYAVLLTGTIQG